jgi:hypothetical protein
VNNSRISFKVPEDVVRRSDVPGLSKTIFNEVAKGVRHEVAKGIRSAVPEISGVVFKELMAAVDKRLAEHLKCIESVVKSIQVHVAAPTAEFYPQIHVPEQQPPTVNVLAAEVSPVFNVPSPQVINNMPELRVPNIVNEVNVQPSEVNPVFNVQQPGISPVFNVPESPPSVVHVNVPKQEPPRVTVQSAKVAPVFNVPKQEPPTVNVQAADVHPIIQLEVPKRTTTTKSIVYAHGSNRPEKIVEESTSE